MIPNYNPRHKLEYWEIKNKFPEYVEEVQNETIFKSFEGKPDLSNVSPEEMRMIPSAVKDGKTDERIDAWIL